MGSKCENCIFGNGNGGPSNICPNNQEKQSLELHKPVAITIKEWGCERKIICSPYDIYGKLNNRYRVVNLYGEVNVIDEENIVNMSDAQLDAETKGYLTRLSMLYAQQREEKAKYEDLMSQISCDIKQTTKNLKESSKVITTEEFREKLNKILFKKLSPSISRSVAVGSVFEDDDNSTVCVIHANRIYQEDNWDAYYDITKEYKSIVEKPNHNDEYKEFVENNAPSINQTPEKISYEIGVDYWGISSDSGMESNRHVFERNYKIKLPYGITIKQLEVFENEW